MPNLGTFLKDEIQRLARRALRPELRRLKGDVAELKRVAARHKREVFKLQHENARLLADLNQRIARVPEVAAEDARGTRISPRIIRAQRRRLGLSRLEYSKLLGVSAHTVFLWEHNQATPRPKVKAALAAVRRLGRRDARERLCAMSAVNGGRRAVKA